MRTIAYDRGAAGFNHGSARPATREQEPVELAAQYLAQVATDHTDTLRLTLHAGLRPWPPPLHSSPRVSTLSFTLARHGR